MFEETESGNAGVVVDVDLSLLPSTFAEGETLRIVTGGTALDQRVVWFDIGIGYTGGPALPTPFDNLVVQSEMTVSLPFR